MRAMSLGWVGRAPVVAGCKELLECLVLLLRLLLLLLFPLFVLWVELVRLYERHGTIPSGLVDFSILSLMLIWDVYGCYGWEGTSTERIATGMASESNARTHKTKTATYASYISSDDYRLFYEVSCRCVCVRCSLNACFIQEGGEFLRGKNTPHFR